MRVLKRYVKKHYLGQENKVNESIIILWGIKIYTQKQWNLFFIMWKPHYGLKLDFQKVDFGYLSLTWVYKCLILY